MQMQALHTVHKVGWTPAYDWWTDHQADPANAFAACAGWIETVPVMPATVLGLELLLQDRSLDLQMASELILRDVGATLHIMRLMAQEHPAPEGRPSRIASCLAALDSSVWFSVLAANSLQSMKSSPELAGLWKHCRAVANYAKVIAESLGEVSVDEAYLAGLLHEVEHVGSALKKQGFSFSAKGVRLDSVLSAPVMTALNLAKQRASGSVWRYVLASAHALATAAPSKQAAPIHVPQKPFVV